MTIAFDNNAIDTLLENAKTQEDILGKDGILKQFTKALIERALQGEITEHLGYGLQKIKTLLVYHQIIPYQIAGKNQPV